jgi:hypothetical protein
MSETATVARTRASLKLIVFLLRLIGFSQDETAPCGETHRSSIEPLPPSTSGQRS